MNVDLALLNRLDLKSAALFELSTGNRLMPSRPDRLSLAGRAEDVAKLFRNKYANGHFGDLAGIVFVEKNRHGRRPISEMSLRDKVLYRALVNLIAESLSPQMVNRPSNQEFKEEPLGVEGVKYISKTDVASYYEYVDHEILADELEAQTGEAPAIAVLMELLRRVMGRRVGIPQVHAASDILGDAYIDPVRRRMRRAGYSVITYSDDFRIASTTLADARQALEMCAREVRSIGLTLNEGKTFTYTAVKYKASLSTFTDAEQKLFAQSSGMTALARLLFFSDYSDGADEDANGSDEDSSGPQALAASTAQSVVEEDVLEVATSDGVPVVNPSQTRAALRAWEIWDREADTDGQQTKPEAAITETLLGRALPILGRSGIGTPVAKLSALLRSEPALTPQISAYITEYAATGSVARTKIRTALDRLVDEPSFSLWQKVWIAEAAGTLSRGVKDRRHYAWLRECVSAAEPALAATAAAALGKLRHADLDGLRKRIDHVGPEWRLLVLWGIASADYAIAKSTADDRLEEMLLEEMKP